MCTVVIDVAEPGGSRLLAVRDEDPERAWDSLGRWWPDEYPGIVGIRDRRAGGAWIAVDLEARRLAVLLNRADTLDLPEDQVLTRGSLALESVAGRSPSAPLRMHGFNLLEVGPDAARVLSWDGEKLTETPVPQGVHMIAHDGLDDSATARIARWLPEFRAHPARSDGWEDDWIDLLAASTALDPTDDAAIIRDNRPHGYPTQSLLYCLAAVDHSGIEVHEADLPTPGHWSRTVMLNGMNDPQQPQVPPYASNDPQPPPPSYPMQSAPAPQQYNQGQSPQQFYQGQSAQPSQNPPQAAGQGYAGAAYSPPAVAGPTDSNAPGKIGFIIGLVGLGLGLLLNVIVQIMIRSQGYELINVVSGVMSAIIFLAAAAALVFGIIGLNRVGSPHAFAGIATGLGGAGVVGTGFNFILTSISSLLYF